MHFCVLSGFFLRMITRAPVFCSNALILLPPLPITKPVALSGISNTTDVLLADAGGISCARYDCDDGGGGRLWVAAAGGPLSDC